MRFSDPDGLPAELRQRAVYRELAVGEKLFGKGDAANSFYMIETGRISLSRPTIESKIATLQFVQPGEIVGESAIFQAAYNCDAIAIIPSRIIMYREIYLNEILEQYPELIEDLLSIMLQKINHLQNSMELREIRAAHQRVLQFLIYAADSQKAVNIDIPLQEVAHQLGFAPATLSRALLKLETEGSITRQSNVIYLNRSTAA